MPNLNFQSLMTLMQPLHHQMELIFYALLVPGFCLALIITYFKQPWGSPEFLDTVKRLCIAVLLLVAFPDISQAILWITQGIADLVGTHGGLEQMLDHAKEATAQIKERASLLIFPNLLISILAYLSYLILYISFFLILALRHFIWTLLVVISPLLIFFYIFPSTAGITKSLFRSLIEVACWDILWRIMSVMIKSIGFAQLYSTQDFLTIVTLNFVIAIAMLGTPFVMKSLVGSGLAGLASTLQTAAVGAAYALPGRVATAAAAGRRTVSGVAQVTREGFSRMRPLITRTVAQRPIPSSSQPQQLMIPLGKQKKEENQQNN